MRSTPALPAEHAHQLFPHASPARSGPIHGACLFPEPPRERVHLVINMVASIDGRVTRGETGSAAGLGSPSDQRLMRRLRAEADAVLVGAGTLRAERFSPRVPPDLAAARTSRERPAQPVGVVVSARGLLPADHPFFATATPAWPRRIYTCSPAARALERPGIEVCILPGPTLDVARVLDDLWQRAIRIVVCEGGPTLNASLLAAGRVDELFLTLAPGLLGGASTPTLFADAPPLPMPVTLRSLYERNGELFFRYTLR